MKKQSDITLDDNFKRIIQQFLCCIPIKDINWQNTFEKLTWDCQETFYNLTFGSDLVRTYPLKLSYQRAFLKYVVSELQLHSDEIHDSIYEGLAKLLSLSHTKELAFKHFQSQNGETITIRESDNIISRGTTGLSTWQASVLLSEWCLQNRAIFKNKSILELGSGTGLVGMNIYKYCSPTRVILSDCHEDVLDNLKCNVSINFSTADHINITEFPWETETPDLVVPQDIDILVGADIVYDEDLFLPLLGIISFFLHQKGSTEMLLACTERNSSTLENFLKALGKHGNTFLELENPDQKNYFWNAETPIKLFSIKSSKEINAL